MLVTSSRLSAFRIALNAALRRTGSPATFTPSPFPLPNDTVISRSGTAGSAAIVSATSAERPIALRLKVAVPASRFDRSLISERSADKRAQDFSASSSRRRCSSFSAPARSFSSMRI